MRTFTICLFVKRSTAHLFIGAAPTASGEATSSDDDSLINEKHPRFKFHGKLSRPVFEILLIIVCTVFPPDKQDMISLQSPEGLISAPILDHYLSTLLTYDKSQILIVPAYYSALIDSCDTDVIAEFPELISSKYILLPVHKK